MCEKVLEIAITSAQSGSCAACYAGGIVGYMEAGVVQLCRSAGSVSATGNNVGGLIGWAYATNGRLLIIDCLTDATVSLTMTGDACSVGGVIGRLGSSTAPIGDADYGSSAANRVYYATVGNCVGLQASVSNSSAGSPVGAFVGLLWSAAQTTRARIYNCYTTLTDSDLTATATNYVGGFVGAIIRLLTTLKL